MTTEEHLAYAERFLKKCSGNDPCAYDNICFAHKARWHVRQVLVQFTEFAPTADLVNALPEKLRQYIHDLATRSDPSGDVATITCQKDQIDCLLARLAAADARIAEVESVGKTLFREVLRRSHTDARNLLVELDSHQENTETELD